MKKLVMIALLLAVITSVGSTYIHKVQPVTYANYHYTGWPLRYSSSVEPTTDLKIAFCLPNGTSSNRVLDDNVCKTQETIYKNLAIDVAFWTTISFAIVFGTNGLYKLLKR